jgi:hypothetical protein
MQATFDDACNDGLLLSLQPRTNSITIYVQNPILAVNSVYRANKTHLWRSEAVHDEIDENVRFASGKHQMVGFALLEIDIPNSQGFKV